MRARLVLLSHLLDLSKVTGDIFRDVVTIPHHRRGLKGGLSRKIREAPPITPNVGARQLSLAERQRPAASPKITGSGQFAVSSIVVELRGFHLWRLPAEGLLLVRNFAEPRLHANKVAPSRLPRRRCPKQPPTKDGLAPRFYPAPNSAATGDTRNGPGLPLCAG
jgi:hypothetical protein